MGVCETPAVPALPRGGGRVGQIHRSTLSPITAFARPSNTLEPVATHGEVFWHSHDCKNAHTPKSNLGYWMAKSARNQARDKKSRGQLEQTPEEVPRWCNTMRITSLKIQNFRSIKLLELELGETTVFIGPNNAGKTAILDAVRIALTRRWGQRRTGFTEYDVHLAKEDDEPKSSPGVIIELRAEEAVAGEWPDGMQQSLDDISQTDPVTGKSSGHSLLRQTLFVKNARL